MGGIGQGWACPSGINPAKPAQAAEIKVPRIVQHTPRDRAWKVAEPDPEAEARSGNPSGLRRVALEFKWLLLRAISIGAAVPISRTAPCISTTPISNAGSTGC